MRLRNSVLMPGWKRSRSALPSASRPSAPFSPSGTSATEPMLAALGAEQEIPLRVAHLAATRLAGGEQRFEGADVGVVGRQLAQERARASTCASEAMGAVSSSTEWNASKSSRRLASSEASAADRVRRAQQAAREAMDAFGERDRWRAPRR